MNHYSTIQEAAAASRQHDIIASVKMDDWADALEQLRAEVQDGEDFDCVENCDVMEFWAFDPESEDEAEMTMRVHVIRQEGY